MKRKNTGGMADLSLIRKEHERINKIVDDFLNEGAELGMRGSRNSVGNGLLDIVLENGKPFIKTL